MADPGFPRGGAPTLQGAPTYYFAKSRIPQFGAKAYYLASLEKLHENERNWIGGGVPRTPLTSPNDYFFNVLF